MQSYKDFLKELDKKLDSYFKEHREFIFCRKGCSSCCEKGDYPLSQLELEYLMQGFLALDNERKKIVQNNFKDIKTGGACPFLINKECSVYSFRPIVCRTHGLAYLCKEGTVKLPYCANDGKNYSLRLKDGMIEIKPIEENLDTPKLLKDFDYGEIRNLCDWIIKG